LQANGPRRCSAARETAPTRRRDDARRRLPNIITPSEPFSDHVRPVAKVERARLSTKEEDRDPNARVRQRFVITPTPFDAPLDGPTGRDRGAARRRLDALEQRSPHRPPTFAIRASRCPRPWTPRTSQSPGSRRAGILPTPRAHFRSRFALAAWPGTAPAPPHAMTPPFVTAAAPRSPQGPGRVRADDHRDRRRARGARDS